MLSSTRHSVLWAALTSHWAIRALITHPPHPPHPPRQVLQFCDSDLEALIKAKGVVLSPGDVKAYMSMLLQALQACHQHWILHRDVKPNNMLISRDGAGVRGGWLCCGVPTATTCTAGKPA